MYPFPIGLPVIEDHEEGKGGIAHEEDVIERRHKRMKRVFFIANPQFAVNSSLIVAVPPATLFPDTVRVRVSITGIHLLGMVATPVEVVLWLVALPIMRSTPIESVTVKLHPEVGAVAPANVSVQRRYI